MQTFSEIAGESTINLVDSLIADKQQDNYYLMAIAPTGKGKSYFIKHDLYDYCKEHGYKILYLLPRTVVVDEFKAELEEENKSDIISVRTYHTLENDETHDYSHYFNKYKFVICDECHYFVSDSIFNPNTDRSYSRIIKYAQHAIKLYITATPTPIQTITQQFLSQFGKTLLSLTLKDEKSVAEQPMKVRFLKADDKNQKEKSVSNILEQIDKTEDETEQDLFQHIPNGEKAIVFCDSAKYAHDLHKTYKKDSLFICSRSNKKNQKFLKDIDEVAYKKMLHEHKFDCKYVFCTSALDVGFSIKDKQVKHIICLLWDFNGIVQAIGRKRVLDPQDTFTVHLRDYNNFSVGGLITHNNEQFEHYNYFRQHGAQAYYNKYAKIPDPAGIIYYGRNIDKQFEPAVDTFVLWYYAHRGVMLDEIAAINSRKYKYQNWVLQQLGLPPKKDRTAYGIEKSLAALVAEGRVFVGNDGKQELARIIGLCDDRGRLLTTPKKINPELQQMGVPYQIVKGEKDKETRKETYSAQPVTAEQQAGACAESAQNAPQATGAKAG